MINILIFIISLMRQLDYIHKYQLSNYEYKKTFKNLIKNILNFKIYKFNNKVNLKFTSRMYRLIFLNIVFLSFFIFILNPFIVILFCNVITFVAISILYPFELLLKKNIVKNVKNKINKSNLYSIAVTGSYGKTSVKNYIYEILNSKYNCLITPSSYNTPMGICLTVNNTNLNFHDYFICEMGARYTGDIKELVEIVNPNIVLITEIGAQHIETFKDIKNIIKTKFEIIEDSNAEIAFLNYDNKYIKEYCIKKEIIIKTFGNSKEYDYSFCNLKMNLGKLKFDVYKGTKFFINIETKLLGFHTVYNLLASIAIADYLGVSILDIQKNISCMVSVKNRLEYKKYDDYSVLDDSYNSNLKGFLNALDTLELFNEKKVIITPGIIETGHMQDEINQKIGKRINEVCDKCFLVGKSGSMLKEFIDSEKIILTKSFKESFSKFMLDKKGKVLLIENDLPYE